MTVSAAMTSSRLYESGTTNFLETGGRGPTLAMLVMLCSPAAVAAAVATGKVEAAAKKKVDVGGSKDEAVKAPTRTVVARPRLPAAMAAAPKSRDYSLVGRSSTSEHGTVVVLTSTHC